MKKILYILFGVSILVFSSCNFLKESSQDEIRPSTVDDLVQLMLKEGYATDGDIDKYLDLFSDDVQQNNPHTNVESEMVNALETISKFAPLYKWDSDMWDMAETNGISDYSTWQNLYKKIMGCNVVLSMIDEVAGSIEPRENLKGQALAMRAFYYFILVNTYGEPYNSGDPSDMLGVPLILEPQVEDRFPTRNSVKEVYDLIIEDLNKAQPLLDKYGLNNNKYKVSDKFVHLLLSRIYLYTEDYSKSLEHSSIIISRYPALMDLSRALNKLQPDDFNVFTKKSVEVLWAFGTGFKPSYFNVSVTPAMSGTLSTAPFTPTQKLLDSYIDDASGIKDLRYTKFFMSYGRFMSFSPVFSIISAPHYVVKGYHKEASGGFRTSEAYINRAEANIELDITGQGGNLQQALDDINYLRCHRFNITEGSYTNITMSDVVDAEGLREFCRAERRREFILEGTRWFDMRRYGMYEVIHTTNTGGVDEADVILSTKLSKFTLPIPKKVIDSNPAIEQNKN